MADSNHHLWLNGHYWWVAFRVTFDGYQQERIRRSLRTKDVHEARLRRDRIMNEYRYRPGCQLPVTRGRRSTGGGAVIQAASLPEGLSLTFTPAIS